MHRWFCAVFRIDICRSGTDIPGRSRASSLAAMPLQCLLIWRVKQTEFEECI
jgi:hypothetical protein